MIGIAHSDSWIDRALFHDNPMTCYLFSKTAELSWIVGVSVLGAEGGPVVPSQLGKTRGCLMVCGEATQQ